MTDINYANFRQKMQELSYKKELLNEAVMKSKNEHGKYLKLKRQASIHFNKGLEYQKEEEKLRKELIEMIPNKWY